MLLHTDPSHIIERLRFGVQYIISIPNQYTILDDGHNFILSKSTAEHLLDQFSNASEMVCMTFP